MMVSLTATLSGLGPEMHVTADVRRKSKIIEAYWRLVDETVLETCARAGHVRVEVGRSREAGRRSCRAPCKIPSTERIVAAAGAQSAWVPRCCTRFQSDFSLD